MSFVWSDTERDSVSAKLQQLFTLPARVFEVPVEEGRAIRVKLRLLNDKETLEVADIVDRYGFLGKAITERRNILARSIVWIEDQPLTMSSSVRQEFRDRNDRPPTEIEEKLWVLELCQPTILDAFFECYDALAREQKILIAELKKNYAKRQEEMQQETKSSQ
jgi:hypothetical protein